MTELMHHLAAEFISAEANSTPLITVTNIRLSPDFREATVFVTVYPEAGEKEALIFLKRKRSDLRNFVKSRTKTEILPRFDFAIDEGEKNRQRVEELI